MATQHDVQTAVRKMAKPERRSIDEIRDELHTRIDMLINGTKDGHGAGGSQAIQSLAGAMRDLGEIQDRADVARPEAPAIDIETLCNRVWHATQNAGAPTAAGDAAVEIIRKTFTA